MVTLETARLLLRGWQMKDLGDFYAYARQPAVGAGAGWPAHQSPEESRQILEAFIQGGEEWAIQLKESGRVVGSIGLHRKNDRRSGVNGKYLGYALAPEVWGRGIATEAVKLVLAHGFETEKLAVIGVEHFVGNERSKRVIQKCGFVHEGTLRRAFAFPGGELHDCEAYSMLAEEYRRLKRSSLL